jgi:hypothetical protein
MEKTSSLDLSSYFKNKKKKEIESTVTSAAKEYDSGKGYGCSSIKELGFCIGSECRNYK